MAEIKGGWKEEELFVEHGIFTLVFFCPKLHSRQTFLLSSVSGAHSYVRMTHTNGGGMQQTFQNANPPLLLLFPFGAQSNGVLFFFRNARASVLINFRTPPHGRGNPNISNNKKKKPPLPLLLLPPRKKPIVHKRWGQRAAKTSTWGGEGGYRKGNFCSLRSLLCLSLILRILPYRRRRFPAPF